MCTPDFIQNKSGASIDSQNNWHENKEQLLLKINKQTRNETYFNNYSMQKVSTKFWISYFEKKANVIWMLVRDWLFADWIWHNSHNHMAYMKVKC